ncbi:C6 zinc finger domain-containing protein [Colletotrichum tofieldiae]|uniref:C6 zinc finger domain-containing protein n=1 Tax=Colletotrichum tofieldiae TaxID=708197 RepID=A0A161WLR4_9PEZI|nr:C6 zinc finger domain-containing protein [Colletotrichum tofieldiae]GKT62242.1 C6 zinc finger domain-containing protein [Colletotrichum tofieldiae]GKT69710.1 C6 zinc finger domain-containing protein [Colletotrichum tofieldiae]
MKCVKSNRLCEGYLDSGIHLLPQARGQVQLVARPDVQGTRQTTDARILITPGYETTLFYHQQQWNSFQSFVVNAEQGDTVLKNKVAEMTPQYAHHEIAIREICSGIGALGKALHPVFNDTLASEEYRQALEHYGRAAKAIFSVKATTGNLPSVILTSLLFTTFEMMAGNTESASKHHNHAVAMMEQHIDLRVERDKVPFEKLKLSQLEMAMFEWLLRHDTHPWAFSFGPESVRIIAPARRFPHCRHRYTMQDIPASFDNISQATSWWHTTQHAMLHHLHELKTKTPEALQDDGALIWRECAKLLQSWRASFAPLLQASKQHRGSNYHRWFRAMTLEALYVESLSAIYARHKLDSNVLPAVTPLYLEMTRYALQLAKTQRFNGLETLVAENNTVRPLACVLYKSRDPEVIREVMSVLKELGGGVGMAESLLFMFGCREQKKPLQALERGWGWSFTSAGITSGASLLDYLD